MEKDKIEVSDDNIFLQTLLEKHGISPKQIAGWTGRGVSTIYKYLSGELTIPSVVWRAIFDHTLDPTVFAIVRGDIPCVVTPLVSITCPQGASLKRLLEMRKKQLSLENYMLQILENGKIDVSDVTAIANFKLAFNDAIEAQEGIYRAITNECSKAEAAKNV